MVAEKGDKHYTFAEELLGKNLVESRSAIQNRSRVEIFRGQDLVSYLKENRKDAKVAPFLEGGKSEDDQVKALILLMMKKGLFSRSERLYKKPHPRRKKLTKFPRKVFLCEDQKFVEGGFYTWRVQRPPTPWINAASYLSVLLVLGCCLFPLAPYSVKIGVFYTSFSLLCFIFGIIFFRLAVYAIVWTALGKYVWVIPNLFADHVPINEIFSPMFEEEKNKRGVPYPAPPMLKRFVAVGALVSALYAAYKHTPEKGYGAKIKSSGDDLFEFLNDFKLIGEKKEGDLSDVPLDDPTEDLDDVHTEL